MVRRSGAGPKTITPSCYTLDRCNFFARAAEPYMNILIFDPELGREFPHTDALVTGGSKRRKNASLQRAAPTTGLRFSALCFGFSRGAGRASPTWAPSASAAKFSFFAGIKACHLSFELLDFVEKRVALSRQLDEALKRGGIDF